MYHGKYEANAKGRRQPVQENAPVREKTPAAPKKRKKTLGTKIFYTCYLLMIIAAAVGIWYGHGLLTDFLMDFEASQPDTKCQEVFDRYFADPDWAEVYSLLNPEAVGAMTQDEFTTYMQTTVGDRELTYTKTSAGLSGGRKYILRLDGENLGTFTLKNSVTGELEIPDWKLDAVEVFVSVREYVTVITAYGNTVTVNGMTLNEDHVIRATHTVAEEYLPEGVTGPRTVTYYLDGLLNAPEVTVTDAAGNAVAMTYDEASKTYTQTPVEAPQEMSEKQEKFVVEATKSYFRFMVNAGSEGQLKKYFDGSSETYKTIIKSDDRWLQTYKTYNFGDPTFTDYCSYGEDLFSVRIAMELLVTRTNNTVKTFSLDSTYFIRAEGNGWIVAEMTNVDVAKVLTQVRLTYKQEDRTLSSELLSTEVTSLKTPNVTVPEGKVFSGWFIQSEDEAGNTTYTRVFQPDETGAVQLPTGYTLEPMVLYALFEEAK